MILCFSIIVSFGPWAAFSWTVKGVLGCISVLKRIRKMRSSLAQLALDVYQWFFICQESKSVLPGTKVRANIEMDATQETPWKSQWLQQILSRPSCKHHRRLHGTTRIVSTSFRLESLAWTHMFLQPRWWPWIILDCLEHVLLKSNISGSRGSLRNDHEESRLV